MQKAFGSRLAALAADKATNAITANAISYPDESGSEKKPDSLHFFRIVKEQPNETYFEMENARFHFGGRLLKSQALVEPTGIEPVTSCLQSRRSPN